MNEALSGDDLEAAKNFVMATDNVTDETPVPPFRDTIVDTNFDQRIKSLQNDPEKILRFDELKRSVVEATQHYDLSKRLFYELRDKYGIAVPSIQTILGYDQAGKASTIIVTDRIHGENLDSTIFQTDEAAYARTKLEHFLDGLVQYYIDKFSQETVCIGDIKNLQFVYGKRKGDAEDQIYFVDIEPFIMNHSAGKLEVNFLVQLQSLATMIEEAEYKLHVAGLADSTNELTAVRQKLLSFLESMPKDAEHHDRVVALRQYMDVSLEERVKRRAPVLDEPGMAGWMNIKV